MATREKTVKFTFDTLLTVSNTTVTNFTQETLYIPETVIAFTDVSVDLGWMNNANESLTENRIGLQLGAAGYTTVTDLVDITTTGENMAGLFSPYDYTSYFTTNWSGTSMTCDMQCYFASTTGMNNVTTTISITYTYNDDTGTNATQIKTVMIPIESLVGALTTTTNSEIGTNQIPILTGGSGLLPEATVVIRDYAFIIGDSDNGANVGGTDWVISTNIDGGTAFSFASIEMASQSNRYMRCIWRPTVPTTTSVHAFQMWVDTGTRGFHLPIMLQVTYEFDASTTSTVLNSIVMPMEADSLVGYSASADASTFELDYYIEEPTTITLKQSAIKFSSCYIASSNAIINVGSQATRTYADTVTVSPSIKCFMHRIDSGGAMGAGATVARGKNTITCDVYSTSGLITSTSAMVILNYHSGLDTAGIGAHNHTVTKTYRDWTNTGTLNEIITGNSFTIPETDYYINTVGFYIHSIAQTIPSITLDLGVLAGEWKASGYFNAVNSIAQKDAEVGYTYIFANASKSYLRFPTDEGINRLDIETARDIKLKYGNTNKSGIQVMTTYHAITYVAADSITGFSGTVTLTLHDNTTGEKLAETSRSGDGAYSFTWYDNIENVYVTANDGTNVGRSLSGVAV